MLKTGTLSYQEFENELLDFIERAKNIQDSWNVEFPKVRSLRTVAVWAQGAYTVLYARPIKCVKEGCRCERFVQGRGQVEWTIAEHL